MGSIKFFVVTNNSEFPHFLSLVLRGIEYADKILEMSHKFDLSQ